jgi:DNA (cytosine-5)-methyltransferase 1
MSATLIDLFCGCGGFSLGAELAGFHPLVAIDNNPVLQSSYKKNFPRTRAIEGDVSEISKSDWRQLVGNVRPDGIIGGPPCQGFSRIGRRSKEDPRNTLIYHFYRHVHELHPKFFVMENVEGLLDENSRSVLTSAIELVSGRYRILGPLVINAAHFGAATNRRRVIVVGYDPDDCDTLPLMQLQPIPGRLTT